MENEIWKDIIQFENLYQISNYGRIKSIRKNIILKLSLDKDGYKRCTLSQNGFKHYYRVSRLVGLHFVDNVDNLPIINHKNKIKTDDYASNLEWVSVRENTSHGITNKDLPTGVTSYKNRYRARIKIEGKSIHLGYFNDPCEASNAYINKLKELNIENKYA